MSTRGGREDCTQKILCWGFGLVPPFGPTVLSVDSSFPDAAARCPGRSARPDSYGLAELGV